MADKNAYLDSLKSLLPPGQAWTQEPDTALERVLKVMAAEFAKVDGRARKAVDEADPRLTIELFAEWEEQFGLPDPCTPAASTLAERRQRLVQKVTKRGGASVAYFEGIIDELGYDAEVTEFRPFQCGISECGGEHITTQDEDIRHYWAVDVQGGRVTRFRTGASRASDHFARFEGATDLECILERLKPAHTVLLFGYTE